MKLNGNSRGSHSAGRHNDREDRQERFTPGDRAETDGGIETGAGFEPEAPETAVQGPEQSKDAPDVGAAPARRRPASGGKGGAEGKKRSKGRVIGAVCGAVVALLALIVIVYALFEKPPERGQSGLVRPGAESTAPESAAKALAIIRPMIFTRPLSQASAVTTRSLSPTARRR